MGVSAEAFGKIRKTTKMTPEKHDVSGKQPSKEPSGILEGVSSLHSWIKNQTAISPHPRIRAMRSMYEAVCNMT